MLFRKLFSGDADDSLSGKIKLKVLAGFSIALTGILLGAYITFASLSQLTSSMETLAEPDKAQLHVKEVLSDLSSAESAVRAYAVTKDEKYLDPYYQFISTIDNKTDSLKKLLPTTVQYQKLADTLKILVEKKIGLFNSFLDVRNNQEVQLALKDLGEKIEKENLTLNEKPDKVNSPTVESPTEKKRFGDRLKRIFRPKEKTDSLPETPVKIAQGANPTDRIRKIVSEAEQEQQSRLKALSERELSLLQTDREVMNKIRNVIAKIENLAVKKNLARINDAVNSSNKSIYVLGVIGVVGLIICLMCVYFIFSDVAKSSLFRKQLLKAKQEAERLARVKEEFLANMSHEIRTPLNSILGFSDQLSVGDDRNAQYAKAIKRSSDHLLHVVNDILDFSKIESGKMEVEKVPYSPFEIINEIHEALQPKASEKNISFVFSFENRNLLLQGDPYRLRQLLLNLAGNAIKFTEKGVVEISGDYDGKSLFIQVRDTGIGIPKEKLAHIFESFSQADSGITRKYGGTGLGLAISKRLVEIQNGDLNVTSDPGKGSTFTFTIPSEEATGQVPETAHVPLEALKAAVNGLQVLLVDDDEMNRLLGESICNANSIKCTFSVNGKEAIRKVHEEKFDIILMDLHMPEMSGIDATRYIRSMDDYYKSGTAILGLTANIRPEENQKCLEAGMNEVMLKPYKEYDFLERLVRLSGRTADSNSFKTIFRPPSIGYSLEYLEQVSSGDNTFVRKMVDVFIKNTEIHLEELSSVASKDNWHAASRLAHKMLPSFKHFKIDHVVSGLKVLEEYAVTGKFNQDPKDIVELVSTNTREVLEQLKEISPETGQ